MQLRYSHIFALRKTLDLSLFSENLCADRWSLEYCRGQNRLFKRNVCHEVTIQNDTLTNNVKGMPKNKIFRTAQLITNMIADIRSEATGEIFQNRLDNLKEVVDLWSQGMEISVISLDTIKSEISIFSM